MHHTCSNPTEPAFRQYRVLLVDDQKMVRDVLRDILEGYPGVSVVAEAANGLEAVALAAVIKPDVIVMDVNMPMMNGIEATKRIKDAPASPVVIGLSINTCTEVVARMKEAGADAFVSKEDGSQHLYNVMTQLVD
ncbi:MAG: response regulator transcription factor [Nitrospirota bacterium]